jgi:hypothetical protein
MKKLVQNMIEMPDFSQSFDYENNFYLSSDVTRVSKILAHYELYKKTVHLPGVFIECGLFKGASFSLFASLRELLENSYSRTMVGFDTFGMYPETQFSDDNKGRQSFIELAGGQSISREQMIEVLMRKNLYRNIELVEGDITKTVPMYMKDHPELKISLLNLDTDIYEPAVTILEHLYPRIVNGGILILDDYGVFPGETKAVDDYFAGMDITIQKFPFRMGPCFIVKEDR